MSCLPCLARFSALIFQVLRQNLDDGSENKLIGSLDDGLLVSDGSLPVVDFF